jgi:hypothetical protein
MRSALALLCLLAGASPAPAQQPAQATQPASEAERMRADALAVEGLIDRSYAYRERLPGGRYALTPKLRAEAEAVTDRRALLRFAERALMLLADHHAITGSSVRDSFAVVPSYADLWIEPDGGRYSVEAVRPGSPAAQAGIRAGDALVAIEDMPTAAAVAGFWADLGAQDRPERNGFAARVLAAGRRDRPRRLTMRSRNGQVRTHELVSLHAAPRGERPPVAARQAGRTLLIRINDALGDNATIASFDAAMRQARPGQRVVIDLTDTPSGGNTTVARAILGWFVDRPRFYQMHSIPAEQRDTGIARQWVEQVLPRPGMRHRGPVEVRVGRWTGSMGEGLAIGFDAIGAQVTGTRMAGLLGAIYDHRLENSGLVLKLPTERLMTVDGRPRESFVPRPLRP